MFTQLTQNMSVYADSAKTSKKQNTSDRHEDEKQNEEWEDHSN